MTQTRVLSGWRGAGVFIAIFVCVFALRFLSVDYLENDHFTYLAFAHQTALGDLPDLDYDDPGFPLGIGLSAIAMRLGGTSLLPEIAMTSAMLGVAACLTWCAAVTASGMPALGLFVTALQLLAYPRLYSYPKVLVGAYAAFAFFAYTRRPTRGALIALAVFTEFAFLLRHDLAVYVSVSTVALLLSCHGRGWAGIRRLVEYAAWCVAFSAPYFAYLLAAGLGAHLDSSFGFSTAEARRTTDWASVVTVGSWLTLGLTVLPAVAWIWLMARRRKSGRWDPDAPAVAATALLLAIVNVALLRDTTPSRLSDVFGVAPVIMAWVGAQACRWGLGLRLISVRLLVITAFVALCAVVTMAAVEQGNFRSRFAETRIDRGWRAVLTQARRQVEEFQQWPLDEKAQGGDLTPLVSYLDRCTREDQPVLVVAYLPQLAFLARRPFAGGHAWFMSGYFEGAGEQRRMADRLLARPPAVVVIDPDEAKDIPGHWPAIADMLRGYRPSQPLGRLQIRAAGSLPERGVDAATQLPCFR